MKRQWFSVLGVAIVVLLCSPGCVFVNVKTPLDKDLNETNLGSKVGKSKMQSVLWLVAWGDAGTQAAAMQGGIKKINHADQEVLSILAGLYTRRTTVVYGD